MHPAFEGVLQKRYIVSIAGIVFVQADQFCFTFRTDEAAQHMQPIMQSARRYLTAQRTARVNIIMVWHDDITPVKNLSNTDSLDDFFKL